MRPRTDPLIAQKRALSREQARYHELALAYAQRPAAAATVTVALSAQQKWHVAIQIPAGFDAEQVEQAWSQAVELAQRFSKQFSTDAEPPLIKQLEDTVTMLRRKPKPRGSGGTR